MIILAVCDCLMQCDNLPGLVDVGLQVTSDPGEWIRCEALQACLPYLVPFEAFLVVFRARLSGRQNRSGRRPFRQLSLKISSPSLPFRHDPVL